jgi:hypothetical protein
VALPAHSAYVRFLVFSARTGLIEKARSGSNLPVRQVVRELPLLAQCGRYRQRLNEYKWRFLRVAVWPPGLPFVLRPVESNWTVQG